MMPIPFSTPRWSNTFTLETVVYPYRRRRHKVSSLAQKAHTIPTPLLAIRMIASRSHGGDLVASRPTPACWETDTKEYTYRGRALLQIVC